MPFEIDVEPFSNPWEHVRLLSDPARNDALVKLLERRAPGNTVLEVGCGTGLFSCIAAKMGAKKVYAVEPTDLAEDARALVAANGLEDIVEVLDGMIEDIPVERVDFAFSELLNANPFQEGVLEAMSAVQPWLNEGGFSSPTRLRVYAALLKEGDSALEVRTARSEVAKFAQQFDLKLGHLDAILSNPGCYSYLSNILQTPGKPTLVWDFNVGQDESPESAIEVSLAATEPGTYGGAVLWFEADLDEDLHMHNRPGAPSHWGQLVIGWPTTVTLTQGQSIRVRITPDEDGITIEPLSTDEA